MLLTFHAQFQTETDIFRFSILGFNLVQTCKRFCLPSVVISNEICVPLLVKDARPSSCEELSGLVISASTVPSFRLKLTKKVERRLTEEPGVSNSIVTDPRGGTICVKKIVRDERVEDDNLPSHHNQ